jgi:hypothetical protein
MILRAVPRVRHIVFTGYNVEKEMKRLDRIRDARSQTDGLKVEGDST